MISLVGFYFSFSKSSSIYCRLGFIVGGAICYGIMINFGGIFLGLIVFSNLFGGNVGGFWVYNGYGY